MNFSIKEPNSEALSILGNRCTNFIKEMKAFLRKKIHSSQVTDAMVHYLEYHEALIPMIKARLANDKAQEEYEEMIHKGIYQEAEGRLADIKPLKDKEIQSLLNLKKVAVEAMLHQEVTPLQAETKVEVDDYTPQSNYYERLQLDKEPVYTAPEGEADYSPHHVEVTVVNLEYDSNDPNYIEVEADAVCSTLARKIELEPEPEIQVEQPKSSEYTPTVEDHADIHNKLEQENIVPPNVVFGDTQLKRAVRELEGQYKRVTNALERKSIGELKPAITSIKPLIRRAFPDLIVGREIMADRDLLMDLAGKMLPFIKQELQVAKDKLESYVPVPIEDTVQEVVAPVEQQASPTPLGRKTRKRINYVAPPTPLPGTEEWVEKQRSDRAKWDKQEQLQKQQPPEPESPVVIRDEIAEALCLPKPRRGAYTPCPEPVHCGASGTLKSAEQLEPIHRAVTVPETAQGCFGKSPKQKPSGYSQADFLIEFTYQALSLKKRENKQDFKLLREAANSTGLITHEGAELTGIEEVDLLRECLYRAFYS